MNNCYSCQKPIQPDFKFCPNCGVELEVSMKCSKCGHVNEEGSKFCKECGNKLIGGKKKESHKPKSIVEAIEPVHSEGITVEFPYSSSQSYDFAVAEAEKFNTYKKFGEDKKVLHRVNVHEDEIETLDNLLEALKGWRSRKVYYKGEHKTWDTVFSHSWCYNAKKESFKPELYCFGYDEEYSFNLWGCKQINLSFIEHSQLYSYGKWLNKNGDWEFDRERIRHELQKQAYKYRFCPAIDLSLIEEVLNAFPEKVNPYKDKGWEFERNYNSDEGLLVKVKEYGYEDTVYMNGVQPKNKEVITKLIAKKLKRKLPIKGL